MVWLSFSNRTQTPGPVKKAGRPAMGQQLYTQPRHPTQLILQDGQIVQQANTVLPMKTKTFDLSLRPKWHRIAYIQGKMKRCEVCRSRKAAEGVPDHNINNVNKTSKYCKDCQDKPVMCQTCFDKIHKAD